MLNEKPNNNFYWKDKLQELESLPGEIFNKEASWERLHTRLQSKPKNKKVIWYWAAAACLLIAILSPWFLSNKKQNDFVKNNSVKNIIQSSSPQLLPVANNKDTLAYISSSLNEKKRNVLLVENDKIISSFVHKGLRPEKVTVKKDTEELIKTEINNNAITPVDTRINIMAIVHEKKKLRVVHINELGDPVEELPVMAHNSEIHSFQLRLANQEVYLNPSNASGKSGFNILPIKNSPY